VRKGIPRAATLVWALMILLPLASAAAGPYVATAVHQASGTPSPPANGDSPFASCDISGFLIPGETNYVNSELEPWVAVNPTNSSNIIGVYQQDRYTFGGARGLAAALLLAILITMAMLISWSAMLGRRLTYYETRAATEKIG